MMGKMKIYILYSNFYHFTYFILFFELYFSILPQYNIPLEIIKSRYLSLRRNKLARMYLFMVYGGLYIERERERKKERKKERLCKIELALTENRIIMFQPR